LKVLLPKVAKLLSAAVSEDIFCFAIASALHSAEEQHVNGIA